MSGNIPIDELARWFAVPPHLFKGNEDGAGATLAGHVAELQFIRARAAALARYEARPNDKKERPVDDHP